MWLGIWRRGQSPLSTGQHVDQYYLLFESCHLMPSLESSRIGLTFSRPPRLFAIRSLILSLMRKLASIIAIVHALAPHRTQASPGLPASQLARTRTTPAIAASCTPFTRDLVRPLRLPAARPATRRAGSPRQRSSGQSRPSRRRRWPRSRRT